MSRKKVLRNIVNRLRRNLRLQSNNKKDNPQQIEFDKAIQFKSYLTAYHIYCLGNVSTTNYRLALCFESDGNLTKARYHLLRIKKKKTKHWLKLAEIENKLNRNFNADTIYSQHLKDDLENSKYKKRIIKLKLKILYSIGDYEELCNLIDEFLVSEYDLLLRKYLIIFKVRLYIEMKRFEEAKYLINLIKDELIFTSDVYQVVINYFFQSNDNKELDLYTKLFIRDFPKAPQSVAFRLKYLWESGNYSKIEALINATSSDALLSPVVANLCSVYSSTSEDFSLLERKIKHWALEDLKRKNTSHKLLMVFLSLHDYVSAEVVLGDTLNLTSVEGCYIKGLIYKSRDAHDAAIRCFKKCIVMNHSYVNAYKEMYDCINYSNASRIGLYLKLRNRNVSSYSKKLPDGMNKSVDTESFQYLFARGLHSQAYNLKQQRPLNRSLKNRFPLQVLSQQKSIKDLSNKKVLIIAEEGVGDELRMSEFYSYIDKYNINATVTCDPRLENIFSKNFKNISFLPVRRKWDQIPFEDVYAGQSTNVSCRVLGKYIDNKVLEISDEFDVICMLNEYISLVWNDYPLLERKGRFLSCDHLNEIPLDSDKIKVGILWSSSLTTNTRYRHYLSLDDYIPLFEEFPKIEFFSLASNLTNYEQEICEKYNVKYFGNIDIRNDFDTLSRILPQLDTVIGISSFITEFAAAYGVKFYLHAISPIGNYFRSGYEKECNDVVTINSVIVAPDNYNQTVENIKKEVVYKQKLIMRSF
ncbi:hypothetical protein AB4371_13005 [Vibrio sp. 10N.261.51.A3]|uniref:hypothetical protein n=1 Tax=Vibrio sp. 10N.261.51.A3 TaxID=3229673 RepID=UPI00354E60BF